MKKVLKILRIVATVLAELIGLHDKHSNKK